MTQNANYTRHLQLSIRLYRALMRIYPSEFRQDYS